MRDRFTRFDKRWAVVLAAIAIALVAGWPLHAPAAAETAASGSMEGGLIVSFAADPAAGAAAVDARPARLVALHCKAGESPSPMLPAGRFKATWSGAIHSRIRDYKIFSVTGRGEVVVTLNGVAILERHGDFDTAAIDRIKLKKGDNVLSVTYTSPADGDASIRLLWADHPGPCDPVPPQVFRHDPGDGLLVHTEPARAGRTLLATSHCFACHQGAPAGRTAMPELSQDAPNLDHLGDRLNADWIACWITNPKALRPTASMPRLFHDVPAGDAPAADGRAADIAAYLTLSSDSQTPALPSDPAAVAHGGRLFTGLGCIACHVPGGMGDSDPTLKRVPLKFVRSKYKWAALVGFLKKPEAHYSWIKMPNFHLSDEEATSLAAYIWDRAEVHPLPNVPTGNADRGKQSYLTAGCIQCHAPSSSSPPKAASLAGADFTRGCVADDPTKIGAGVDYGFTPEQRDQLRAAAAATLAPMAHDVPTEFAARQMSILRCTACHSLDGQDGAWANLDQDVATIEQKLLPRKAGEAEPAGDQSPPALTWAGEKLHSTWMQSFIAGTVPYKPRQWLVARMPALASRAAGLTTGLNLMHGVDPADETNAPADASLGEIGRGLTSRGSFGCVACHGVGEQPPLAPFEAPAPNFAHVSDRLRHDYFTRWMRHPQSYIPGTKMPQFGDADGKTAYKNIMGGDADQQYQAIWNYLLAGAKITPPQ